MITYKLPRKIRYVPASAIFTALFNIPTIGKYDFNGQAQTFVYKLVANTLYFIDSISIAGNISAEDFLSSIDTIPLFTLRKSLDNEAIFDRPIQIHSFATDRQIVHFFKTGQNNCDLIATITGKLNQTANFLGLASVSLSVNLSIHAIEDKDFELTYKQES